MGAMVTVFAPDGTQGQIPQANVRSAVAAGGKLGIAITAPDGTPGYVPVDRLSDAMAAGGKPSVAGGNPPPMPSGPLPSGLQSKAPVSDNPIQRSFDEQTASDPQYGALQNIGKSIVRAVGSPVMHPLDAIKSALANSPLGVTLNPQQAMDSSPASGVSADYKAGGLPYALSNLSGTAVGTALLGAVAGQAPAAIDGIPSTARAGESFNDLNTQLANQPVKLNSALAPLQRAVEIGGRGSTLPKAVADLLARSESPLGTDMTFPEARDYQGALSDLSTSDKLAMNGRMRGAVAQLNKGLYSDIYSAADQQGMGPQFAQAMNEYRQASQVRNALATTGKVALGATGAGGLVRYLQSIGGK